MKELVDLSPTRLRETMAWRAEIAEFTKAEPKNYSAFSVSSAVKSGSATTFHRLNFHHRDRRGHEVRTEELLLK